MSKDVLPSNATITSSGVAKNKPFGHVQDGSWAVPGWKRRSVDV